MNFFPWLLWRRWLDKKQDRVNRIYKELGENKVIAELAERDPETREALNSLGVKTPSNEKPSNQ